MEFVQKYGIYGLGFFAQSLFGARLIVQLLLSEKKGKVVSPTIFWQLSLMASFLFLIYGIIRNDLVIIIGQTLSYLIYIRNLQLKNDWVKFPLIIRVIIFALPVLALGWIVMGSENKLQDIFSNSDLSHPIIAIGAVGQLMLNLRFIYQWYYSEKHSDSILPLGFWVISSVASVMILAYASYRLDPVLLVAQGMGIFVYLRNIVIHFKARAKTVN
ncbi:lipid-A-disaccharide synthase N-terminal domain-containing protein [Fulvivirgaceae bacterium PWU4]|uniref:Lipid-A-disaccharide synthase N-terminal domain-containing protein n=1 Tax=Chryseosolibacter histidini TaxID=2782349 RepID=A0AAP2DR48_9BACT|nr:lipid-A-disaccharide synthase N-terminal domain-containing protein [Chryseosolibacter histidini]MBT1700009.1 lipid-A-disaccharide synthase N-terminal domain-containing protein [Chryseosolibacter histidini]